MNYCLGMTNIKVSVTRRDQEIVLMVEGRNVELVLEPQQASLLALLLTQACEHVNPFSPSASKGGEVKE